MTETIDLVVEPRVVVGKSAKKLRRTGVLPGVLYGYNLKGPLPIQVHERTFARVYLRAGTIHLVDLHIGEAAGATQALIHGVTRDPISHVLTHVDFMAVNPHVEATANVPVQLMGDAPAVREDLGMLLQVLETVQIKALPSAMPDTLQVDVSGLTEVGSAVHVRDLTVPVGVTLLTDPEETVALITAVRRAAEEEEAAEAAAAEATSEAAGGAEAAAETPET